MADIDACGKSLAGATQSRIHTGIGVSDIHVLGKFRDDKYGDTEFSRAMRKLGIRRLMLHASSLELPSGKYTPEIVINAPLPSEFEQLFDSIDYN